jgi:hypothetical protein
VDAVERDAIDAVVRRRYGIAPGTYDREVAQRALGELEARRRFGVLSPPGQSDALATIESVYGPLRALALSASESELRVEIRNRNEFAAIAAGMRKEAALYEDCRRLFAVASAERASSAGERERVLQSTAAAWAMLCMDREQSAEIVLDAQLSQYLLGERALWLLLGHSECPRVTARLESVFGPGVSDLAQELRSVAYDVRLAVRGLAEGRRLEDFWFER